MPSPRAPVLDWSDDLPWSPSALIRGASWRPPLLWDDPPMDPLEASLRPQHLSPSGAFGYANVTLPRGAALGWQRTPDEAGTVRFTTDVTVPVLFDEGETVLSLWTGAVQHRRRPWMSVTPMEVVSLQPLVRAAQGDVVIGGLGLGWLLRRCAERPGVRSVTVVEASGELLDWVGPRLAASVERDTGTPVRLVRGDVFAWMEGRPVDGTTYLLDIWKVMAGASRDPRLAAARARGLRVLAWGDPGGR